MASISYQEFDSDVFGVPFFRINDFEENDVEEQLEELVKKESVIIDAKIDASDLKRGRLLQKHGFRKVCTQVELTAVPKPRNNAHNPSTGYHLSASQIVQHVNNFVYDRFSLDYFLNKTSRDDLYAKWISNSLSNPEIIVFSRDAGFCTAKERSNQVTIDLISVLDKKQGTGSLLLRDLSSYAYAKKVSAITVITECENADAVRFYLNNWYQFTRFLSCYHYVKR